MGIVYAILTLSIIAFLIHLRVTKKNPTKGRIVELILLYQLIFNVGIMSFLAFYGHMFLSEKVAKFMAFSPSGFQIELANANLAFGVLGILSIWFRGHFWTATILGSSIWLIADGIDHIVRLVRDGNDAPGNSGYPLYSDIISPAILLILLFLYLKWNKKFPKK